MSSASINSDINDTLRLDNQPYYPGSLTTSPTSTSSDSILESDKEPGRSSYWRNVECRSAHECLAPTSLPTGLCLSSGPSSSSTLVYTSSAVSTSFEEDQDSSKDCDIDTQSRGFGPDSSLPRDSLKDSKRHADPDADLESLGSLTLRDEVHAPQPEGSGSRGVFECNEGSLEKGKGRARHFVTSPDDELSVNEAESEDAVSSNEHAADLTNSVVTVRPPSPSGSTDHESNPSAPHRPSSRTSTAASPHSDRSYTFEVRPPSTLVAQEHGTSPPDQSRAWLPFYAGHPAAPQSLSVNSRYNSGLPQQLDHNDVAPAGLRPIPPSTTARRPSVQQVAEPPLPSSSRLTMENLTENAGFNHISQSQDSYGRPLGYWLPPIETNQPGREEFKQGSCSMPTLYEEPCPYNGDLFSPSAPSPLVLWPPSRRSTLPSEPALTPSQTGRSNRSIGHFDNPGSTPWIPPMYLYESPARARSPQRNNSLPTRGASPSQSPIPSPSWMGMSNPPSAPERTRRFAAPLPPSPGSSLRTSVFNSPYMQTTGATSADSWGTATDASNPLPTPNVSTPYPELPLPPVPPRAQVPPWVNGSPPWPELGSSQWGWSPSWSPGWADPRTPQFGSAPSPAYVPGYTVICNFCRSPAGTCSCRRRMSSATPGMGASMRTGRPAAMPHPTFWFPDGTVIFEVEEVLFKVHKYFFERHSTHFRSTFARRLSVPSNVPYLRIPDIRRLDFERLLMVFYPSYVNPDLTTVEDWTSVLTLAVKWRMDELMSSVIHKLTPITSAVDKISLAKKFGLFGYSLAPNTNHNRDWLLPALKELCTRNLPIRMEEAKKLDMWTVIKVWEVQYEILHMGLGGHDGSRIERLIKRRFGLET